MAVLLTVFVAIQFFGPERYTTDQITGSHLTEKLSVPESVRVILKRSCYDCHSDQTVWPWYSSIAPVSWLVADDVKRGRVKVNFSEWGKLSASKQEKKLADICDVITEDEMPLKNYLLLHPEAKLSRQDKDILCNWVKGLRAGDEEIDSIKEK